MRTKILLLMMSFLTISCNQKTTSDTDENTTLTSILNKSVDLDKRYIGAWKLVGMIPEIPKNDTSMEGIICNIEKYPNTKESYLFYLFTGHQLILSVENNNYLKGQNANMNVHYKEDLQELHLSIPGGSTWIFKKLK